MSVLKGRLVKIGTSSDGSDEVIDVHSESYDSTSELVNDLRTRKRHLLEYDDMMTNNYSMAFEGVHSYKEALEMLRDGYQPLVDEVKKSVKKIKLDNNGILFKRDVVGFTPIVPNALKNLPDSMVNSNNVNLKTKVVDIYYDNTARSDTQSDTFLIAGKILLEALTTLELMGYRFNLHCCTSYYHDFGYGEHERLDIFTLKVKNSDKPLDLKRLVFPLVHPAFFRVIGFDWQDKSPVTRWVGWGRGRAIRYEYDHPIVDKIFKSMFGYNSIYISCTELISDYIVGTPEQSLADLIIDRINNEDCPRDKFSYSKAIPFNELMYDGYKEGKAKAGKKAYRKQKLDRQDIKGPGTSDIETLFPNITWTTTVDEQPQFTPRFTTSDMTPDELHDILMKEVDKLRRAGLGRRLGGL